MFVMGIRLIYMVMFMKICIVKSRVMLMVINMFSWFFVRLVMWILLNRSRLKRLMMVRFFKNLIFLVMIGKIKLLCEMEGGR